MRTATDYVEVTKGLDYLLNHPEIQNDDFDPIEVVAMLAGIRWSYGDGPGGFTKLIVRAKRIGKRLLKEHYEQCAAEQAIKEQRKHKHARP